MNNLKLVPAMSHTSGVGAGGYSTGGAGVVNGAMVTGPMGAGATGGAAAAANAATMLRKTASESNLLKMKMKGSHKPSTGKLE